MSGCNTTHEERVNISIMITPWLRNKFVGLLVVFFFQITESSKSAVYNIYTDCLFPNGSTALLTAASEMSPFYNVFPCIARAIPRAVQSVISIARDGISYCKEKMGKKALKGTCKVKESTIKARI